LLLAPEAGETPAVPGDTVRELARSRWLDADGESPMMGMLPVRMEAVCLKLFRSTG